MTIVAATPGSVTIELDGRRVAVRGEFFPIASPGPTLELSASQELSWDDGTPLSDAERRAVFDDLLAEARARGWGEVEIL